MLRYERRRRAARREQRTLPRSERRWRRAARSQSRPRRRSTEGLERCEHAHLPPTRTPQAQQREQRSLSRHDGMTPAPFSYRRSGADGTDIRRTRTGRTNSCRWATLANDSSPAIGGAGPGHGFDLPDLRSGRSIVDETAPRGDSLQMADYHLPVQQPRGKRVLCVLVALVLAAIGIYTVLVTPLMVLLMVLGPHIDGEADTLDWWMAVPVGALALLVLIGVAFGLVMCWRGFRPKRVRAY